MLNKLRRWRSGLVASIVLGLVSLAVAASLIETVIFYALDIKPPGYRPERFIQFDPMLGWSHRASARGYWYRYNDGTKFRVSINSKGFSDAEWRVEKTRPRVALIGDSTIEGWDARPEARGQVVIAELLGGRAEVLNLGVRGYGTDQAYLLLKSVAPELAPDVVVYTFCVNDLADNRSTVSKPYFVFDPADSGALLLKGYPLRREVRAKSDRPHLRAIDVFARDHSFIYRRIRGVLVSLVGYRYPLETHDDLRPFRRDYDAEDRARMDTTLRIISAIDAYCKANGMRFLLVDGVTRWEADQAARQNLVSIYGDIFDFDRVSGALAVYSAEHGIEFVSLPDTARECGLRAAALMHREDTIHLDARGIRFLSDEVVRKLRSLGWM